MLWEQWCYLRTTHTSWDVSNLRPLIIEPMAETSVMAAAAYFSPKVFATACGVVCMASNCLQLIVLDKTTLIVHMPQSQGSMHGFDLDAAATGTDTQRLFVANLKKRDEGDDYVIVADHKGRVVYVTNLLAQLLGYPVKEMIKMEFCKFMAQPFQQLHTKWMRVSDSGCRDAVCNSYRLQSCWSCRRFRATLARPPF